MVWVDTTAFRWEAPDGSAVRAEYLIRRGFGVALLVSGPSFGAGADTDQGRISIRQELGALQVTFWPRQRPARVEPRLALGVGGYHLAARGTPAGSGEVIGRSDSLWALLALGGAGVVLALGRGLGAFVDAQVALTSPQPAVDRGTSVARAGNPSLMVSLGLQRMF